jgi:DNA-damage-inducible protein J
LNIEGKRERLNRQGERGRCELRTLNAELSSSKEKALVACVVAQTGHNFAMKDAIVRARVCPDLKADAERVFEALGINTTEAIRMFLSQVRLRRGLPFSVDVPNDEDLLVSSQTRRSALDSVYDD